MPILQYENVTKEYRSAFSRRSTRALDGFSLQVEPGEIFGFLGPNGAGKTTAIHLAMGFMRPTGGHGAMLGRPFGHADTRRRVGFLPEQFWFFNRSGQQIVELYGRLNAVPAVTARRRGRELLDRLELGEAETRKIKKYSRGMLQKVGLAQALVNDPDLLVLDEPTSALDPVARVTVRELLLEQKAAGKSVFLSSHLLSEIEAICDRVAFVRRGKLVWSGRTADLLLQADTVEIACDRISGETASSLSEQVASRGGLLILSTPQSRKREVIERIWAGGGDVVSVVPKRRTLEQMFLEIARGEDS